MLLILTGWMGGNGPWLGYHPVVTGWAIDYDVEGVLQSCSCFACLTWKIDLLLLQYRYSIGSINQANNSNKQITNTTCRRCGDPQGLCVVILRAFVL